MTFSYRSCSTYVNSPEPANQGHGPAIQTTVWGMKDREIVAAIVAGDPAGLAGAYDKYAESLYGY